MGREKKKINISSKLIYSVIAMMCIGLIVVSYLFPDVLAPVRTAVGDVFAPMQKGITVVGNGISEKLKLFSDKKELIEQNEKLTDELNNLKIELQMLGQQKSELNFYRELYEYDSVYLNSQKVAALVIGRDPNDCTTFIVDKGADDGITPDMNVMAGGGLVGIVTETGKNWARIRTIIDDDSSVSGRFQITSDTCIVKGNTKRYDDGVIDVEMINLNAAVYDNYEVVTSYISEKYLPGILIGYVSNVRKDPSELNQRAYLTPVVDFEHLEAVLIIKAVRESLEGIEQE